MPFLNNKTKKRTRFSLKAPEVHVYDCEEMTESVQKALWYRKKDLQKIKQKIAGALEKLAAGDDARSGNKENCCRGLEPLIRDQIRGVGVPTRKERYEEFSRGLLEMQQDQRILGFDDGEEIRRYCLSFSMSSKAEAKALAAQDCIAALKIYQETFAAMGVSKVGKMSDEEEVHHCDMARRMQSSKATRIRQAASRAA
jgi:hypothetical protein